jgi:hypothetical protein
MGCRGWGQMSALKRLQTMFRIELSEEDQARL